MLRLIFAKSLRPAVIALMGLVMMPLWVNAIGAAGTLDPSFGDQGMAILAGSPALDLISENPSKCVRQADGKVVAMGTATQALPDSFPPGTPLAGTIFVARYLPDGSFDPAFGIAGTALLPPIPNLWSLRSLNVQDDGKILLGGIMSSASNISQTPGNIVLIRLLADGSLDAGFGVDGISYSRPGARYWFDSLVILGDGKIVVGGPRGGGLWLARYLANGSVDTSFGSAGVARIVRSTQNNHNGQIGQFIQQPDGRYLIHSVTIINSTTEQWTITRVNADGTLDTTFGSSGSVGLNYPGTNTWDGCMALAPDGSVLLAVPRYAAAYSSGPYLARYTSTGQFEGYVCTGNLTATGYPSELAVLEDGTIIGTMASAVYEFGATVTKLADNYVYPGSITPIPDNGFLLCGWRNYGSPTSWRNFDSQVTQYNRAGTVTQTYFDEISTRFPTAATATALGAFGGNVQMRVHTATVTPSPLVPNQFWDASLNASGAVQSTTPSLPGADPLVHITQGPSGPVALAPAASGWVNPWAYERGRPGNFVRSVHPSTHFTSSTCMTENWLGEVFIGGQMANRGVVRRFGLTGAKHTSVTGQPAMNGSTVAAMGPRFNGGLMVLLHQSATGNGRLVRLTPQMTPDAAFGKKGQIDLPGIDVGVLKQGAIAVLPDERVLLARHGPLANWVVSCYLPKGELQTDYGTDGILQTPFVKASLGKARAIHLLPLPSGGVLIAGATDHGFALGRWDRNGRPDATFGTSGLTEVRNDFGLADFVESLIIDAANDQILIGGATVTSTLGDVSEAFAARFNADAVSCRVADPRALPIASLGRKSSTQKLTLANRTAATQANVRVRLYGLPATVRVNEAVRLPGVGEWELTRPISLAAGATQQLVVTYSMAPVRSERSIVTPPVPNFTPLVESVTDSR